MNDSTQAHESPFLPGTKLQYAWDSTSIGYLKTCPRLYEYVMIEGWTSAEESVHLRFGTEYHQALHDYEKSRAAGIPHDDAVFDTVKALIERLVDYPEIKDDDKDSIRKKTKDHLLRTVVWYLDQFEDDPAKTYIMADGKPAMELSFRFELDYGPKQIEPFRDGDITIPLSQPFLLCGHLDRVVVFNDDLFVMDRKTTTSTPGSYYFDQYEPNNQMTLYTLASQVIMKSPVKGVIIDAAQVAVGFSRFVRGFTYRTEDQIDEWLNDLAYWLRKAEEYADMDYWPMNDTACDKFGGCRFRSICSKSPQVRERFLKGSMKKGEPWNPLFNRT